MTILLLSNKRDITTDYIVLELRRRDIEFLRLNSEHLGESSIRFSPDRGGWEIELGGHGLSSARVSAGYFRRPAAPVPADGTLGEADRRYCAQEWASVLRSFYAALDGKWFNAPAAIAAAEDKPRQLTMAIAAGLHVPATLITNDHAAALDFVAAGAAIAKPLSTALLGEGGADEHVIFTSRIEPGSLPDAGAIALAPVIFQREIPKAFDIRATVVGHRVFAASIESQIREETSVDWRRGSYPDLPHRPHELPHAVAQPCVALVRQLGLRFAAIDLVLDPDGTYWFLEANPNGQWAWIENRTGLAISAAIVDELVAISQTGGGHA